MLSGLFIKLGNNEWTNTPAASALVYAPRVSFVPFLSLSLSLPIFSLCPRSPCPPTSYRYGGMPRMCVQAKAHHGGVGYQTRSRLPSAGFSFSLFPLLLRSYSLPLSPPAYLFPSFITVLSFSFSFPPHLFGFSLLSLLLSLFLSSQRGSHLGECVASSNAPSRITINYLLRHLLPSTSSRPVLHSAIYIVSDRCVSSYCARK